ncbi:hypothetical protein [Lysobacter enzymogenes]
MGPEGPPTTAAPARSCACPATQDDRR